MYTCVGVALLCLVGCATEELVGVGPVLPPESASISATTNSGCLNQEFDAEPLTFDTEAELNAAGADYPGCDTEAIVLTAGTGTLGVVHTDATHNCCAEADEIVIALEVDGTTIKLTEAATVANPCRCLCCFDVEATLSDLDAGTYTVEFCWEDQDGVQQCDTQTVTIG